MHINFNFDDHKNRKLKEAEVIDDEKDVDCGLKSVNDRGND